MKTTKNWSKMLLAGMAAMVLAFGLVLVGCDDGNGDDTGGGGGGGDYDGTYINATVDMKLVISGSNFTISADSGGGSWMDAAKGTFTVSGTTFTAIVTHDVSTGAMAPLSPAQTDVGTISSDGRTISVLSEVYTKQ